MKQIMCPTIAILFVVIEFCCNKIILLLLKILYCNKKYCCNIKLLSNSPTFFFLSNTIKWNFAHKITKRKKKTPNHTNCGSVTCEGWFTVDLQWARSLIAWLWLGLSARIFLDLVFWAWFWLWWLGWVTGCVVLDRLRECLQ